MAVTNQIGRRTFGTANVYVADQRMGGKTMRSQESAGPLDLVNLTPLMRRTQGAPEVVVALIDGLRATTTMMTPTSSPYRWRHWNRRSFFTAARSRGMCRRGILSSHGRAR